MSKNILFFGIILFDFKIIICNNNNAKKHYSAIKGQKMASKEVAILDFGSQCITVAVGFPDVNHTINVTAFYEEPYEGFMDGEFIEPNNLEDALSRALAGAEKSINKKITSLTIGVPTEFCFSMCKTVAQTFIKPKKITRKDLMSMFDEVSININTHTIINRDFVYFVLGENNKVENPIGYVDSKITAGLSFILAENSFIDVVCKALIKCGVQDFDFVSSAYAQGLYLFDKEQRDRYLLLVDTGYITTSVALFRGRGVLELSSFSLGGGHICADLSSLLKIPFDSAESLFKKVVLCIEPAESDTYEIVINKQIVPVSMRVANAIVESRIEVIAKGIQKCFNSWQYKFPDFIPVYITGGGLALTKGGKDVLANVLLKNVEVAKMPYSQHNRVNNSSSMAVLDYAINKKNNGGKNV